MENKNIFQNFALVLLVIISLIALFGLFKGSSNLKESKRLIDTMMLQVKASKVIIENQAKTIADLQKLNKELAVKVNSVDSTNSIIKKSLDANLYNANKNINEIKNTIANIKTIDFH